MTEYIEIIKFGFIVIAFIFSTISTIVSFKKKKAKGETVETEETFIQQVVRRAVEFAETCKDCSGTVKKVIATSQVINELMSKNMTVDNEKISNTIEELIEFSKKVNTVIEVGTTQTEEQNQPENKTWFNN